MKISGFTFVRNATKLYYPVTESILSILPICDEFVVALGKGDEDDRTAHEIRNINSNKIKIIETEWNLEEYKGGTIYAQQTDIAKQHCGGDWLFYIQSDEVVHEKFLDTIWARCSQLVADDEVEGLLFDYKHFWGDYDHYIVSHVWYPREIRIIRNRPDIHSWRDAQSFRSIPEFDGKDYYQKKGTRKLKVATVDAEVYHYGWVRPPEYMQKKRKAFSTVYRGDESAERQFKKEDPLFNYGDLEKLSLFTEAHPEVMKSWISRFNWKDQLYPHRSNGKMKHKHEKWKYLILTFIEQKLLGGRMLGGFKNYKIVNR